MYIPTMFPRNYFHILTALDELETVLTHRYAAKKSTFNFYF